jgi:RNA-directed DNA polymerase
MSIELSLTKEELRTRFYNLRTFEDLAAILDIPKSKLYYYAFKADLENHYKVFNIPKKSGGTRIICAPSSPIKIIQKKLNQVFQAVYVPKASVHGFTPGRSILSNAKRHLEGKGIKKFVFNVDIKNFFPSITILRVENLLSSKPYNLPHQVSRPIALLCCYQFKLPQGAPTSPIISNMICSKMDTQLRLLAKDNKCVYTRYADDITFSTTLPSFPSALAKFDEETNNLLVGEELNCIIELNGFTINEKKIRLQSKYKRQEITGLTVNKFPNVQRNYVRQIRAMLHAWEKYGLENAQKDYIEKYSKNRKSSHLTV